MNWYSVYHKLKRYLCDIAINSRIFLFLSVFSFTLFIFLSISIILQSKVSRAPIASMHSLTSNASPSILYNLFSMEVPNLNRDEKKEVLSPKRIYKSLVQRAPISNQDVSEKPNNAPDVQSDNSKLLVGENTSDIDYPSDINDVPVDALKTKPSTPLETEKSNDQLKEQTEPPSKEAMTSKSKAVLIYHTHNRESWLPELKGVKNPDFALDQNKNITLVGERIKQKLEKRGVATLHSDKDYPSSVKDFKYPSSYKYSKKTVQEAFSSHPNINYLFDIHRDSQKRSKTTKRINGKDYAQIYFVIGEKNPNWEKNLEFTKKIHDQLNAKYPGISKGIYQKNSNGNGEYNQSMNPNSTLIEIGGVENTLAESYRTADLLAEVVSNIYFDAVEGNAIVAKK
ncbi:stage II sporulation protein P [Paenibacillus sp. V4I3]|uniref:stage II sporulation protein P n=1 Tax=Paenibacillus sp. V4I3 TaxID=3042305 RepID=UPI0027895856|nr:stage II sporulation protein P [Paenibacillus sp. V4I3]MDQ0876556.1 stage II sporulation protein P [Paenibacillus sp. V4I3]